MWEHLQLKLMDIFSLCPQYVMRPQSQSTCYYIVNLYVKLWHVRLVGAINMHLLSWGGGGTQREKMQIY